MNETFTYLLRVRYAECDAQQVVFNARYGEYVDLAWNEFMRAVWGDYRAFLARDMDIKVARYEIDWSGPAHFDEVLAVAVQCTRTGNTSFTIACDFRRLADQQLLATARIVYVLFQPSTGDKLALPSDMKEQLLRGAPGVVVDHAGANAPASAGLVE